MNKLYAIFGGNFDPIHYGHIYAAKNLKKEISIKKIIFLPNNNPPHRDTTKTSISDKLTMIKLAIYRDPLFEISNLETTTQKIFYTSETLKKIRNKIGYLKPLCFIIGEDHLQYFDLWKDWEKILLYSHLLICPRIHIKRRNYKLKRWIISHSIRDHNLLHEKPFGFIFFSNIPTINISSTEIRSNYSQGISSYKLLPPSVNKYIILKKLYRTE